MKKKGCKADIGSLRDKSISIKKQIEIDLIKSEAKYRAIFEDSLDGILAADIKTARFAFANPMICKLTGYKEAELTKLKTIDLHPKNFHRSIIQLFNNLVKGKIESYENMPILTKSKKIIYLDMIAKSIKIRDKTLLFGFFRDNSERKKAVEFSENILSTMPYGLDVVDENLNIRFMNKKFIDIFGKKSIGKKCYKIYRDNKDQCEKCPLKSPIKIGETKTIISKGIARGKIYEITHTGIRLDDGSKGIMEVFRDVTELNLIQEQLNRISMAIEQSPVIVIITNLKGNIVYVNPIFCQITGYKIEEVLGRNPRFLKSGKLLKKEDYKVLWKSITSGKVWRGQLYNKKKNGEHYWAQASISPIKNNSGKITHFIGIQEDITDRKKNEDKLLNQMIMLERFKDATVDQILDMKNLEEENIHLKEEMEILKNEIKLLKKR